MPVPGDLSWSLWLPLLAGLGVIACESTRTMGAAHTQMWLTQMFESLGQGSLLPQMPEINHVLRKTGHFLGYGSLGVLFARVWFPQLMRLGLAGWQTLRLRAAACAVGCTFMVAGADEWHQAFLPGRTSAFSDVLLDTAGAVLLNGIYFGVLWTRRQRRIEGAGALRQRVITQTFAWPGAAPQTWQSSTSAFAAGLGARWTGMTMMPTWNEFVRLWAVSAGERWTVRARRLAAHGGRRLLRADSEAGSNLAFLRRP